MFLRGAEDPRRRVLVHTHTSPTMTATKPPTRAQARTIAAEIGCTIRKSEHGEYRVNSRNGPERTAYYTDDLADAIGTARAMAARAH